MKKLRYPHDSYWELCGDPREDIGPIAFVGDSDLGDFDYFRFQRAKPLGEAEHRQLAYVRLWAKRDKVMPDYFDSMSPGWHILSERFVALLKEMEVEDKYELIAAPLYWEDTLKPIQGYQILNPLSVIECMDKERSKAVLEEDIGVWSSRADQGITYLHREKVPTGAKLFTIANTLGMTVLRGDIVAEYYKRGFTGAWFRHLPTEGEEYIDNEDAA
jgi:hypothetical protein